MTALDATIAAPPAASDPDAGLVAAARRDPAQFAALYDRYFDRVLGYVRVRIGDPVASEDVTSQAFCSALAKLNGFRGRGPFAAWLFRIARNAVRDELRRRPAAELASEPAATDPGPEDVALARERANMLRGALAALRRDHQHVLALRYGAGLNHEELGAVLGIKPGAARVRAHRALEELRRRYPDAD